MIKAILACDSQGGIARKGVMPWPRNQKDLQHFKKLTTGSAVIMGRKTWEAEDMPSPLPGRDNVVVTHTQGYVAPRAYLVCSDLQTAFSALHGRDSVFIIGGASIFHQAIDKIDVLHLTRIAGSWDCDTHIDLDKVAENFVLLDRVEVDKTTQFETYLARRLYDLSLCSVVR